MCINFHTDINQSEENCGGPDLTVAILPKSGKIVFLQVCATRAVEHTVAYIVP